MVNCVHFWLDYDIQSNLAIFSQRVTQSWCCSRVQNQRIPASIGRGLNQANHKREKAQIEEVRVFGIVGSYPRVPVYSCTVHRIRLWSTNTRLWSTSACVYHPPVPVYGPL
eukprot:6489990-Pyramimonas_sp.AAC.1